MFRAEQISLSASGQTETLTSPRCALRSSSIMVRDWPIPEPIAARHLAAQDRPVVGQLDELRLPRELELPAEARRVDADAAGHQLVPPAGDGVPDEDVAVQPVHRPPVGRERLGRPVVVVGRTQLVRQTVRERPADPVDEHGRMLPQDQRLPLLAGKLRIPGQDVLGVEERELVGQQPPVGERRPFLDQHCLRRLERPPDPAHGLGEVLERAVLRPDRFLPVPLVDIRTVIVIEEVVLPHGPHVGEDPFARRAPELPKSEPLPFRRCLHDLGVERMRVVVVCDVERDRRPRAVSVEIVVDAARPVDDQGHLHLHEVQLVAEPLLDHALRRVEGVHRLAWRER